MITSNDIWAIRPDFFNKYKTRRNEYQKDSSYMKKILIEKADDLETQYSRVLKIEDDKAIINIQGPLSEGGPDWLDVLLGYGGTSYINIRRAANECLELFNDGQIMNVELRMNTPGGNVDGCDLTFIELEKIRSITTASNAGLIASAGVWLASAAKNIIPLTPSSMIGSIGVVIDTFDLTGFYEGMGVKEITLTNTDSPNKRPDISTSEGQEIYIKELNSIYEVFMNRVLSAGNVLEQDIRGLKGEVIIASEALQIGLMQKKPGQVPGLNSGIAAKKIIKEGSKVETLEDLKSENEKLYDMAMAAGKKLGMDEKDSIIKAESKRVSDILCIAGVEVPEGVLKAIEEGKEPGAFAVDLSVKKKADETAAIEAQKKLREGKDNEDLGAIKTLKNEDLGAESNKDKVFKHVDAVVDEQIKKQKGAKK